MTDSNRKLPTALIVVAVVLSALEVGTAIAEGRPLNVLTLVAMALLVLSMVLTLRGVR